MKPQVRVSEVLRKIRKNLRRIKEDLVRIWEDLGTPGKTWKNIGLPRDSPEESEETG